MKIATSRSYELRKFLMLYKIVLFFRIIFIVMVLTNGAKSKAVTLVRDGKPACTIITTENPTLAARLAAKELQYHIQEITGAVLPVITSKQKVKGTIILVGESETTRQLGLKSEDFMPQEYLIRIKDEMVILMGRDWQDTEANHNKVDNDMLYSMAKTRKKINYAVAVGQDNAKAEIIELPGILDDQGTCYATYDFLERFCNVRWYGPSLLNIVIPSKTTLTISPAEIRRMPSLLHRNAPGGGWPIIRKQWGPHHGIQKDLFDRRIRFGGEKWACNHSFSSFRDRFLVKNPDRPELWERYRPDFFAVGWENEGFWRQLCLTNPDLIEQVVQDARDYFDGKGVKGRQVACGDYFAIVPQDSDHWCKCDRCQAILARGKSRNIKYAFGTGTASDYVFGFVNAVAREVRKTHPNKYIATLAYHVYSYPPTFPLESNVAVAPCVQLCYDYQKGTFENDARFYNQWISENKGRRLYLWNYFHHPMERALIGGWKCFPCFMPEVISKWVKRYHHDGVRGYFLCGIPQQLDYYLYMQTAFNADTDYVKLVDEFFARYFGSAGEPMKKFYYRISEINREEGVLGTTPEASWERLGTEPRMNELGALIDQARELAQTDLEKRRVETWKEGVWDYMLEGRREFVKKKRAYEQKELPIAVYSTGVDDEHRLLPDGSIDTHWRLTDSSDDKWIGPNTYTVRSATAPIPPWSEQTSDSKSKWITPRADSVDVAPGIYIYEQTFNIDERVNLETASLFGRFMGDDIVERIEINGVKIDGTASFATWINFLIIEHLVTGENILRIVVKNSGNNSNPHGIRIEISGSADRK